MGRAKKTSHDYQIVEEVKAIRDNYFHCESALRHRLKFSDNDHLKEKIYREYINEVDRAMNELDGISKEIITKEFFYCADPYWWLSTYPKTTYYRNRKEAINKFLKAFYA